MKIDENGIKIDSWAEILERRANALRDIYGEDIDLSQNTPDGQRVGIEARMEVDLQQLGAYIYNEMDPDLASMNGLRILGKLTGVQARIATHSTWDIKITTDRNMSIRDGFAIRDNVDQKWTAKAQDLNAGENAVTFTALLHSRQRLDNWYAGSDNVAPLEDRLHDYSDGFALVGVNTGSSLIPIPSVITQIGDAFASGDHKYIGEHEYTGNHDYQGDHVYTGDMVVNGDYTINGNLTVTGTISAGNFSGLNGGAMSSNTDIITTKDVVAGSVSLKGHTHGGVESGGSNTGSPN